MTKRTRELVVLGKDSPIVWFLLADNRVVGADVLTGVDLVFRRFGVANVTITSALNPTWFQFTETRIVRGKQYTVLEVDLKDSALTAGFVYQVDVYLKDAAHPAGHLWDEGIQIEVRAAP